MRRDMVIEVYEEGEDGLRHRRPAENLDEIMTGLSEDGRYPSDIRGELTPAEDLTFKWMRWDGDRPGIFFEVPDYLEKGPQLLGEMLRCILEYTSGRCREIQYTESVQKQLTSEEFILAHQPTCLNRMSVRGAAGDVYDLDDIYRDLVKHGDLEPDKYAAFGWDASAGDDRDSPYGLSRTFHVVTIPAFMDDPYVPRKAIEYMVWCAVRRLNAGPFSEPKNDHAPTRLGPGVVWLYELMTALSEGADD